MKFLSKIFSPVILIISIFLLLYTFYKSEFHWDGQIRGYYYKYYLISSILIIISIVTFILSKKVKEYIIISSFSLIFSLYSLEIYFSFNPKLSKEQLIKEKIYKEQTGIKWDGRTKYEIYNDLKKLDDRITITLYPNNHVKENYSIFPLSGISDAKTINCNENGFYSTYLSDRYGFNNPNHVWDSKEIEYLLVGDSYVHGFCVNRPNDIASVLRNLSNKSVLNLGYGGIGPLIEYAILREYLNSNIKKVLWFYAEQNDLSNLEKETENKVLTKYYNDQTFSQSLKSKQSDINKLIRSVIDKENKNDKFSKIIKLYFLRTMINLTNEADEEKQEPEPPLEFKKILKMTKELIDKNNAELYFIYIPEYSRYTNKYDNKNYILVNNIVKNLDIPFIDIHKDVFAKEPNPLKYFPFEFMGHYNVDGYNVIANHIFKTLSNSNK